MQCIPVRVLCECELFTHSNMLAARRHVKLSDFGLCKATDNGPAPYLEQYKEEAKKAGDSE